MVTEWVYFKKNVKFNVGVRYHLRDADGLVLSEANPYVNIDKNYLRDFLTANKSAIEKGLIVQVDEPVLTFESQNAISDEEAETIVKNLFTLKKRLPEITSEAALGKLYEAAKRQKRAPKIIEMIENRLMEISPSTMMGEAWDLRGDENNEEGE
jgi:DNA-directed RNA polymerase subunit H (RpoH/RPB5)